MSQVSAYLRDCDGGYLHWCPGCAAMHMIPVSEPLPNEARWSFDGDLTTPTFHPSVNISWEEPTPGRCHYFLHAGQLKFCSDSTHALSGQTVPLPMLSVADRTE